MEDKKSISESRWVRKSSNSVKETADRLFTKLDAFPEVMRVARLNQQDIAMVSGKDVNAAECLLIQNTTLVGKLLSANLEAGFELPIRVFIWQADDGQVWVRCTDIDHLDSAYQLNGADGAIAAINSLLPDWLDYMVAAS